MTNKPDGPFETYHENGQLKEKGTVTDGEKNGPFEMYYGNGELESKGTWKNGERDGLCDTYDWKGQLVSRRTFTDGKLNGPFEFYHDNGQLKGKLTMKDGYYDGLYENYNSNGQLYKKRTYKDGKLDGPVEWFENSTPVTYPPCSDQGSTSQHADEGTEEPFVFGGSLMNGLDIEILDYADPDPPLSEEEEDALWEVSTPYYLLEECSSVDKETLFETEVPLYSDEYHEYTVSDLGKFGIELGKIIRQKLEENSE